MDSLLEHDPDILHPPWGAYGRDLTLGVVSSAAKFLLRVLNRMSVPPADLARFHELTMRREPGVGLLTYCNHTRWPGGTGLGVGDGWDTAPCVAGARRSRWTRTPAAHTGALAHAPSHRQHF